MSKLKFWHGSSMYFGEMKHRVELSSRSHQTDMLSLTGWLAIVFAALYLIYCILSQPSIDHGTEEAFYYIDTVAYQFGQSLSPLQFG